MSADRAPAQKLHSSRRLPLAMLCRPRRERRFRHDQSSSTPARSHRPVTRSVARSCTVPSTRAARGPGDVTEQTVTGHDVSFLTRSFAVAARFDFAGFGVDASRSRQSASRDIAFDHVEARCRRPTLGSPNPRPPERIIKRRLFQAAAPSAWHSGIVLPLAVDAQLDRIAGAFEPS